MNHSKSILKGLRIC